MGFVLGGLLITIIVAYSCKGLDTYKLIKKANTLPGIPGKVAYVQALFSGIWNETTTFDANAFEVGSLLNAIDKLSSGRLTLAKAFLERVTFLGTIGEGIQTGTYYAYNAHNQYIHALYVYGILGGSFMNLWLIIALVILIKRWNKNNSVENFLHFLLL